MEKETAEAAKAQTQQTSGNIDQIRDILFGNQVREYDKRFTDLEDRLGKKLLDLRTETTKRFESLENYMKSQFDALAEQMHEEKEERVAGDKHLDKDLKEAVAALEKKLAKASEQQVKNEKEFRQQLLDLSKTLREELRQNVEDLAAMVQRHVENLRNAKTDRAALAALFMDLAMQLNSEAVPNLNK